MTPADRDAAVALAQRILHRGVKDGTYGVVYRDNVYEGVAAAEVTTLCLAVAERPTCACRWEHLPGGAGASGPQIRECGEHHGLRMRVEEQAATIARLEGERDALAERQVSALADQIRADALDGTPPPPHVAPWFMLALGDAFVAGGATNAMLGTVHGRDGRAYTVTVQAVDGKTPQQLIAEAEAERDALRARVREWEEAKAAWEREMYSENELAAATRLAQAEAALRIEGGGR